MASVLHGTYPIQQYSAIPLTPLKYAAAALAIKPADDNAILTPLSHKSTLIQVIAIPKHSFQSRVADFFRGLPPLNMSDTSTTPLPRQYYIPIPGVKLQSGGELSKPFSALNISIGPAPGHPTCNKRMHPDENARINDSNEIHGSLMDMWSSTVSYLFRCVRYAANPALRFQKNGWPGVPREQVQEYLEDEARQFHDGMSEGNGWRHVSFKNLILGFDVEASMWTDRDVEALETSDIKEHGGVVLVTASKWQMRTERLNSLCRERTVGWLDPTNGTNTRPFGEATEDNLADMLLARITGYCQLTNTSYAVLSNHDLFTFIKFNLHYTVAEISTPIPFHSAPLKTVAPAPTQEARESGVDPRFCFLLSQFYDWTSGRLEQKNEIPEPARGLPDPWDVSVLQCWVYWMLCAEKAGLSEKNEESKARKDLPMKTENEEARGSESALKSCTEAPPSSTPTTSNVHPSHSTLETLSGGVNEANFNLGGANTTRILRSGTMPTLPSNAGSSSTLPPQTLPFPLLAVNISFSSFSSQHDSRSSYVVRGG